jgi:hypothetical protein
MLAVMRGYLTLREDALLRTVSDEFSDGYEYQTSSVTLDMSGASRQSSLVTLKVLVHRYPGLRRLRIEKLQQRDEEAVFAVLQKISKRTNPLKTLEVTNCQRDVSPDKLSKVLTNLTSLTKLDLSWNKFRADGATALAPALTNLTSLTALDLSYNWFTAVQRESHLYCVRAQHLRLSWVADVRRVAKQAAVDAHLRGRQHCAVK